MEDPPTTGTSPKAPLNPVGSSVVSCPNESAFCIETVSDPAHKVEVASARKEDEALWEAVFNSPTFRSWVSQYEKNPSLILKRVEIKHITLEGSDVKTVILAPHVELVSSPSTIVPVTDVVLVEPSDTVAILVMLRSTPKTPKDAPAGNRRFPQAAVGRDHVLFCSEVRPATAQGNSLEIFTGSFDASGLFVGRHADILTEKLAFKIYEEDVVQLTDTKASGSRRPLAVDPSRSNKISNLYLYRRNIEEAELAVVPRAANSASTQAASDSFPFRVAPLSEAWKMTSDSMTVAALCLFHEWRYHGIMPKYKAPRDAKIPDSISEKRKPEFTTVGALNPGQSGVNLRVMVVTCCPPPSGSTPESARKDKRSREANFLVGDKEGTINLKVDHQPLLESLSGCNPGACFCIRNASVSIHDSYMMLCVDKWGKVQVASTDDEGFAFEVDMNNNRSLVEYELVNYSDSDETGAQHTGPNENFGNNMDGGRRGGGRGRGRGGRGGRRGRNFRGGPAPVDAGAANF